MSKLVCDECENVVTECDNPNCRSDFSKGDAVRCLHTADGYKHHCGLDCTIASLTFADKLTETQVSEEEEDK